MRNHYNPWFKPWPLTREEELAAAIKVAQDLGKTFADELDRYLAAKYPNGVVYRGPELP